MDESSKRFFKYRSPSAAVRCLEKNELYFAHPSQLNDMLETKYSHASIEDFIRVSEETMSEVSQKRGGPDFQYDRNHVKELDEVVSKENRRLEEFTDDMGIFSASPTPNNQAMWAYYAENSTGICLELEFSEEVRHKYGIIEIDVAYHEKERIHNRANDWRDNFHELPATYRGRGFLGNART